MGLFDQPAGDLFRLLTKWDERRLATWSATVDALTWPEGDGVVMEEDAAVELGNPSAGSRFFLLWTDDRPVENGRIRRVGPALCDLPPRGTPLGTVILVRGSFDDPYECYCDLRDAVYGASLDGFSVRTLPSRQQLWCRVSKDAMARGFTFDHLAAAWIRRAQALSFVQAAEVFFVTSPGETFEALAPIAQTTRRIVEALMKMGEEMRMDCEDCEYFDVCDTVQELRRYRDQLAREKGARR